LRDIVVSRMRQATITIFFRHHCQSN
jgi:hypothetical protein